ncbi:MAG: transketolase family protein [Spirochaetes bacterium]|nr:MAG: transketolase family protein [Spirochaetota bacterium]RKX98980.1 MAG: transketolase family protein [Spirochaetota bacterium]
MDMRDVYTETLIELAGKDERIVLLEADLMNATGTRPFKVAYPDRFINVGVSEADMVGVAAGLSAAGKIPFAASFGCFASRRVYDQFFLSANYAQLNVNLVGTDPGVTALFNGGTHMTFEDAGIMRNIPQLRILEPSDEVSLRKLLPQIANWPRSVYLRLHRKGGWSFYGEDETFEIGKGKLVREGSDITLASFGMVMLQETLKAADLLEKKGIHADVIDVLTLKPLDRELVLASARKTGQIVTCENHNIYNGLGSAVAEVLAEDGVPARLRRIGCQDKFGEVGKIDYLMEAFGLTAAHIAGAAEALIGMKKTA